MNADESPLNINREVHEPKSANTSTDQLTDPLSDDHTKEPVPFKLMKLPAFISIVSCDDEPVLSLETPKPVKTKQGLFCPNLYSKQQVNLHFQTLRVTPGMAW